MYFAHVAQVQIAWSDQIHLNARNFQSFSRFEYIRNMNIIFPGFELTLINFAIDFVRWISLWRQGRSKTYRHLAIYSYYMWMPEKMQRKFFLMPTANTAVVSIASSIANDKFHSKADMNCKHLCIDKMDKMDKMCRLQMETGFGHK